MIIRIIVQPTWRLNSPMDNRKALKHAASAALVTLPIPVRVIFSK